MHRELLNSALADFPLLAELVRQQWETGSSELTQNWLPECRRVAAKLSRRSGGRAVEQADSVLQAMGVLERLVADLTGLEQSPLPRPPSVVAGIHSRRCSDFSRFNRNTGVINAITGVAGIESRSPLISPSKGTSQ